MGRAIRWGEGEGRTWPGVGEVSRAMKSSERRRRRDPVGHSGWPGVILDEFSEQKPVRWRSQAGGTPPPRKTAPINFGTTDERRWRESAGVRKELLAGYQKADELNPSLGWGWGGPLALRIGTKAKLAIQAGSRNDIPSP